MDFKKKQKQVCLSFLNMIQNKKKEAQWTYMKIELHPNRKMNRRVFKIRAERSIPSNENISHSQKKLSKRYEQKQQKQNNVEMYNKLVIIIKRKHSFKCGYN